MRLIRLQDSSQLSDGCIVLVRFSMTSRYRKNRYDYCVITRSSFRWEELAFGKEQFAYLIRVVYSGGDGSQLKNIEVLLLSKNYDNTSE